MSSAQNISPNVLEAAATWYVDLQDNADSSSQAAHRQWLEAEPVHRQAWARVEKLQKTLAATPKGVTTATLNQARVSRRQAIKTLSVLLMTGAGSTLAWQQRDKLQGISQQMLADYRTAIGEHQEFTLPDNSQLHLNTATAVDVRYTSTHRNVHLYQGEIQINTAKEKRAQQGLQQQSQLQAFRPFIVHTPQGSIRALGTRFLVHTENEQTRVSVLEHAVAIQPQQMHGEPIILEAGQQLSFNELAVQPAKPLNATATAWTKGLLIASNWRLDHFLNELSRYRPGRLSCDASVAALRISGSFNLTNTNTVLENLAATLPVDVHYLTRYWVRVGSA